MTRYNVTSPFDLNNAFKKQEASRISSVNVLLPKEEP